MKPLASGSDATAGGLRNEDALALQAASDPRPAYEDVNPYALPLPLAPELAARDAGVEVGLAPMLAAHARLAAQADVVVVEGGGAVGEAGPGRPGACPRHPGDPGGRPAPGLPQPCLPERPRHRRRRLSPGGLDRYRRGSGHGAHR